jgi:uncharacterized membrane protein YfcA
VPVSILELVVALGVSVFAAVVQGTIGIGFGVVSVPLLTLVNPVLAPVPQLLVVFPMTLLMAWREHRHIDRSGIPWIIAGRIPGSAIGIGLLVIATVRTLDALIAVAVLIAVVVIATGRSVPRTPSTLFGTGVLSGVMALVASIGGPPVALLYKDSDGAETRSSLAVIFSIGIVITVTTRVLAGKITGDDLLIAALLFPAMPVGLALSSRLTARFEGAWMRRGILTVATVAAVTLLARATMG